MNVKVTQYGVHQSLVSSVTVRTYTIDSVSPSVLLTVFAKPEITTGTGQDICVTTTSTTWSITCVRSVDVFDVVVNCCGLCCLGLRICWNRTSRRRWIMFSCRMSNHSTCIQCKNVHHNVGMGSYTFRPHTAYIQERHDRVEFDCC